MPLNAEKVIAAGSPWNWAPPDSLTSGIGIPTSVASVAHEEGILNRLVLNTEVGVLGGLPQSGKNFGPAKNPSAFISQTAMFDFYDGGGLGHKGAGILGGTEILATLRQPAQDADLGIQHQPVQDALLVRYGGDAGRNADPQINESGSTQFHRNPAADHFLHVQRHRPNSRSRSVLSVPAKEGSCSVKSVWGCACREEATTI